MNICLTSAIPSQPWHCKTAWTSRQCPVCWATTTPDSPFAPTPTPPGRSRTKQRKPWETSWSRSCEHKRAKNTGQEGETSCPVLSKPFRTFLRVGHGVGQAVDPHFDPHRFGQKSKQNPRNHTISGVFWSCWADSNRRPHPYQWYLSRFFRSYNIRIVE